MRAVVRDAFRDVRFYRDLYSAAGIDADRFSGIEDLERLPLATKDALLRFPEADRLRKGRRALFATSTSTSGTTCLPLTIHLSQAELYFRRYTYLRRLQHHATLRFPLRLADVGPMVPHLSKSVEQRTGLVSILRIPGSWPMPKQREALLNYRPAVIEGYPTCLRLLAETLNEREARGLALRLVASRGETLKPAVRELLECRFMCPVANLYSCEEVGAIAWECPEHAGRFHVNYDTCVCELAPREPGDQGSRVVVTNLYNRTMPFIRYLLGDTATALSPQGSTCSCGGGRWLEGFEARDDDFLVMPDGRLISPRVPGNVVYNALRSVDDPHSLLPGLLCYQVIQDETYALHVRLKLGEAPDPALWDRIRAAMEQALPELPCTVEQIEDPELTAHGKFKTVISRAGG